MCSEEQKDRIIKHKQERYEIVEYAKEFLHIENPQITIEEMSVLIKNHIKQRFSGKEKSEEAKAFITDYYRDLPDMIEKYLQEDIDIVMSNKIEKKEKQNPDNHLPENPILMEMAQANDSVIRKWGDKYKCSSLRGFILEYGEYAENLDPSLIRDYLVDKNGKRYSDTHIRNMLSQHKIT